MCVQAEEKKMLDIIILIINHVEELLQNIIVFCHPIITTDI